MAKRDVRVDAYIETAPDYAKPILKHIRRLVGKACPQVEETLKWSMPHFVFKGMLCSMAAFKGHCALSFWKAALIFGDAAKRNEEAMGHFGRITSVADLPGDEKLLAYIRTAARLNQEGIKVPRSKIRSRKPLIVPPCLTKALQKNARALATFEKFSPSHQREYAKWIAEAKRDETRATRLATAIMWLSEGKARNWKYQ